MKIRQTKAIVPATNKIGDTMEEKVDCRYYKRENTVSERQKEECFEEVGESHRDNFVKNSNISGNYILC